MPIKAILFDKDGTLIDFDATFAPATERVFHTLSDGDATIMAKFAEVAQFDLATHEISRKSVLLAGSLADIGAALYPYRNTNGANADVTQDEFTKQVDALYIKFSAETVSAFPYLDDTLSRLRERELVLGVATNDSLAAANEHLRNISVLDHFVFVAGYDSGHGAKPGAGMVTAFIETLGVLPKEVAMVGDTLHDCYAGRSAGAITIAVTSGNTPSELLTPHADHVLDNISQIPDLLDKLDGKAN